MVRKTAQIISTLIIIISLFSLSACFKHSPYSEDQIIIVTQTSYAIPGASRPADPGSMSKIIETDEYGRNIFVFNNGFTLNAVGIVQKHDDKYVYYYDNISFFCTEKYNSYTPEQLEALKEANDWEKPLNEGKMIKREFVDKYHLSQKIESGFKQESLENAFNSTITSNEKMMTFIGDFDTSQTGQIIYFVSRIINKSTTGDFEYVMLDYYLMILNSDGTYDLENYLMKIDDINKSNEPLTQIKERNGWQG